MAFNYTKQTAVAALNETAQQFAWDKILPECSAVALGSGGVEAGEYDPVSMEYYRLSWRSWVPGVVVAGVVLCVLLGFIFWLLFPTWCFCCCRKKRVWLSGRQRDELHQTLIKAADAGDEHAQRQVQQMQSCCCCHLSLKTVKILETALNVATLLLLLATLGCSIWAAVVNWETAEDSIDEAWDLYDQGVGFARSFGSIAVDVLGNVTGGLTRTLGLLEAATTSERPLLQRLLSPNEARVNSINDTAIAMLARVEATTADINSGLDKFKDDYQGITDKIGIVWQTFMLAVALGLIFVAAIIAIFTLIKPKPKLVAVGTALMLLSSLLLMALGAVALSTASSTISDSCLYWESYLVNKVVSKIDDNAARLAATIGLQMIFAVGFNTGANKPDLGDLSAWVVNSEILPAFKADLLDLLVDQAPQSGQVLKGIADAAASLLDGENVLSVLAEPAKALIERRGLLEEEGDGDGDDDGGDDYDGDDGSDDSGLADPAQSILDMIQSVASDPPDSIGDVVEEVKTGVQVLANGTVKEIADSATNVVQIVRERGSDAVQGGKDTVLDAAARVIDRVLNKGSEVNETIGDVRGRVEEVQESLRERLPQAAEALDALPERLRGAVLGILAAKKEGAAVRVRDLIADSNLSDSEVLQMLGSLMRATRDVGFGNALLAAIGANTTIEEVKDVLQLFDPEGSYIGGTLKSIVDLGKLLLQAPVRRFYFSLHEYLCCTLSSSLEELWVAVTATATMACAASLLLLIRTVRSRYRPGDVELESEAELGLPPVDGSKKIAAGDSTIDKAPLPEHASMGRGEVELTEPKEADDAKLLQNGHSGVGETKL